MSLAVENTPPGSKDYLDASGDFDCLAQKSLQDKDARGAWPKFSKLLTDADFLMRSIGSSISIHAERYHAGI